MDTQFDSMALTLFLPLMGALVVGCMGNRLGKKASAFIASSTVFLSFLIVATRAIEVMSYEAPVSENISLWQWMTLPGNPVAHRGFVVDFGIYIDPLSLTLMSVITGVGFLIHWFSTEYMAEDPEVVRYFTLLNLFIAAMTLLVLANNFATLIIGWGGVGFASFGLIGFWRQKPSAAAASKKAFVMNVIGDVGLMVAVFLLYWEVGHLSYDKVFTGLGQIEPGMLLTITLGLMVGAYAKSAQLPLHTWLPDAMEGPTPVSALIHAATMVTAGVYLLVRCHPILELVPVATNGIAWFGAITALFAATSALVQTDLKRVLAYSTMSQLGYMFLAVGVGAYGAAVFHLVTHAFFKALLFLTAGIVIHAAHGEQDMRKLGGLAKRIPTTALMFGVGGAALAGVPVTAGYFSKEAILHAVHHSEGGLGLFLMGAGVAVLTAFYTARAYFMTFHGPAKVEDLHLPGAATTISCMFLTVLAFMSGWLYGLFELFLRPDPQIAASGFHIDPAVLSPPALVLTVLVLIAIGVGYRMYASGGKDPFGGDHQVWNAFRSGWGLDELYGKLSTIIFNSAKFLARAVDRFYQQTLPDYMSRAFVGLGQAFRESQTGQTRHYMVSILVAMVFLLYCSISVLGGGSQ